MSRGYRQFQLQSIRSNQIRKLTIQKPNTLNVINLYDNDDDNNNDTFLALGLNPQQSKEQLEDAWAEARSLIKSPSMHAIHDDDDPFQLRLPKSMPLIIDCQNKNENNNGSNISSKKLRVRVSMTNSKPTKKKKKTKHKERERKRKKRNESKMSPGKLSINWSPNKRKWSSKKTMVTNWPFDNNENEFYSIFKKESIKKEHFSIKLNIDQTPKMRAEIAKRKFLRRRTKTSFQSDCNADTDNDNDHYNDNGNISKVNSRINSWNDQEIIKVFEFISDEYICKSPRMQDWDQLID